MESGNEIGLFPALIGIIFGLITLIGMWKVFAKAGKPGWASIIPFYNNYTLIKIAGKPGWWLVLYFIPLVNIVIYFIVSIALAKQFGRSTLFGIFLLGLFGIGYLILGFGKSTYTAPSAPSTPPAPVNPTPPAPPQPIPS